MIRQRCPLRSRCPNEPPRSFIILGCSNNYAGYGRDTKFKPLILGEIHAADDKRAKSAAEIVATDGDYCGRRLRASIAGRARGKGTLSTRMGARGVSPGSRTSHSQMR